jgi:ATP adenylyltransferase
MQTNMQDSVRNRRQIPAAKPPRFASIFTATGCPRPLYDEVLFEVDGCVVTPTLGSILPHWLLVIPPQPVANFAQWRMATGTEPHDLVRSVLAKRSIANSRAIWFEHGPAHHGSPLSCGVDHAHLHVIIDAPFTFQEFISATTAAANITWKARSVEAIYSTISAGNSYLIAGTSDCGFFSEHVDSVGSQFFRRIIAALTGQPHSWDYKTHPHIDNIRKTIQAFAD